MPRRVLHLDIEADDAFINQIDTSVRKQWSSMSVPERAIVSILIKALNDSRQARTKELNAALPQPAIDTNLDEIINTLRTKYHIPVIVSVGRCGGYRLPVSRAECNWFLQTESSALFRKIERLVDTHKAMADYGIPGLYGIDAFSTLLKVHKLKSTDRPEIEQKKKANRR